MVKLNFRSELDLFSLKHNFPFAIPTHKTTPRC